MRIWADLSNAPQVLFMQPLVAEMRKRGHEVLITTRDFTETIGLADRCGFDHIPIDAHGGKGLLGKAIANFRRGARLAALVRSHHAALAVGSSCGQAIAAALLRLPMVALGDYEGQPGNHVTFRIAARIIVPDALCKARLGPYGGTEAKVMSYPGIKEQVYLAAFCPDPGFRASLGIPAESILVTMRPPSTVSAYHRFRNTVFGETLRYIAHQENTLIVLLPRGMEQRQEYEAMALLNVTMPSGVLDGPQLVYSSDLVVGAGGTMNREATVLGTPAYSQFQGCSGSVDEYLIQHGKMARIVDCAEIPNINVCRKRPTEGEPWKQGAGLARQVVDEILA